MIVTLAFYNLRGSTISKIKLKTHVEI